MYEFFLGLDKYLPAFTPEFATEFAAQADSLADYERRERMVENIKRQSLAC